METFLAHNAGPIRTETLNGRECWVVPMTHLAEGVLNGSQGALFYPAAEIARNPGMWNGVPITRGHPTENGAPVSARHPRILEKYQLGTVFNDRYTGGKRSAEAWFDKELTKNRAPEIAAKLEAKLMVPVSTGVYTDNGGEPGEHGGAAYAAVARNYRADHLAVLDGPGACDVPKCGLNVNGEGVVDSLLAELEAVENMFCPTGEGGGVDPSCSAGGGGQAGRVQAALDASKTAMEHSEKHAVSYTSERWHQRTAALKAKLDKHLKAVAEGDASAHEGAAKVHDAFSERHDVKADSNIPPHFAEQHERASSAHYEAARLHRIAGKLTTNANPDGCNQYKPCGAGDTAHLSEKARAGRAAEDRNRGIARRREAVAATEAAVSKSRASMLKGSIAKRGEVGMEHALSRAEEHGAAGNHEVAAAYHDKIGSAHAQLAATAKDTGFGKVVGQLHTAASEAHIQAADAHRTAVRHPVRNKLERLLSWLGITDNEELVGNAWSDAAREAALAARRAASSASATKETKAAADASERAASASSTAHSKERTAESRAAKYQVGVKHQEAAADHSTAAMAHSKAADAPGAAPSERAAHRELADKHSKLSNEHRKYTANELTDNAWSDAAREASAAARAAKSGAKAEVSKQAVAKSEAAGERSSAVGSDANSHYAASDAHKEAGDAHIHAANAPELGYGGSKQSRAHFAAAAAHYKASTSLNVKASKLMQTHNELTAARNSTNNQESPMDKKTLVTFLTANCKCLEKQEQALNSLDEAALVGLVENQKQQTLVTNALNKPLAVNGGSFKLELKDGVLNAKKASNPKGSPADDDPEDARDAAMAKNRLQKLLEADPIYNAAKEIVNSEQRRLATALVANAAESERPALLTKYSAMDLPSLRELVKLTGNKLEQPAAPASPLCNWFGVGGGPPAPIANEADSKADIEAMTANSEIDYGAIAGTVKAA